MFQGTLPTDGKMRALWDWDPVCAEAKLRKQQEGLRRKERPFSSGAAVTEPPGGMAPTECRMGKKQNKHQNKTEQLGSTGHSANSRRVTGEGWACPMRENSPAEPLLSYKAQRSENGDV